MKLRNLTLRRLLCTFLALVPVVTPAGAAVLPAPTITSSATSFSASFVPTRLFDNLETTEYASATLGAGVAFSTTAGTWIQMDFGAPVTMDRMLLMTRNNAVDAIGNYRLILSNDATFDATDSVFTMSGAGTTLAAPVKAFTQTTARYARWEVATSTGTSQNLGGAEMRFLNAPAGSALITPVTAYGSATPFNASYARANAVNGNAGRGGNLEYACASLGAGMFVDFDMGSVVPVNGFDFFDRIPNVDRTTAFSLIFDDDSSTFASPVATLNFSPGSLVWGYTQAFAPVNARYVRLDATATTGATNNSGIQEIMFYRDSNVNAPLVSNTAATSIAANSATVGGSITRVGVDTPNVTIYYGTGNGGTTIANWQSSVNLGPQTAAFSTGITGLLPLTRYYFTSFAQNTAGSSWAGNILEFVTPDDPNVPLVSNSAATAITAISATVGGTITNVGINTPNVTLYYGTTNGGTTPGSWQSSVNLGPRTGAFTTGLAGLVPFTRYYFTCFAQNTAGSRWASPILEFATPVGPPVLTNLAATELTIATARAGVTVTNTGGRTPIVTLYYGASDGGTAGPAWQHQVSLGGVNTTATAVLGGLAPGTQYYFRGFGVNEGGSAWAPATATFTTPVAALPVVENLAATQINAFSANLNGRLTSTGNAPTTVTIYYGPADGGMNVAAWAFSSDAGLQAGDFSSLVTNLTATTPFYFRTRAVNAAGTAWAPSTATFTTTAFTPVTVYLNEFVPGTDNDDPHPHCDSDGSPQDWIEFHNPAASAVDIGGYYLSDNAARLNKWRFPTPTIIPANGFLVVFASNKDRAVSGQQLHTNFRLAAEGEYLALVQPNATTIVKEWSPAYPVVPEYWSYGLTLPASGGTYAPFQIPTPGAQNSTTPGAPAGDVVFSIPSQTFSTASVSLTLTTASPTAQIRYTTNRTEPTAASTLYTVPLTISTTTMIRARAIETTPGFAPGLVHSETYVKLGAAAATFTSNLPVVVVDNFGAGKPNADTPMFWTMFTPNAATANRTALTNAPALATRGRMVVRGSSSAGWLKYSMNIEAWDEANEDTPVSPLGMAPEADWILQSNYDFDRGMIRNPFMYEFSNRIGRWAPRWKFVEVFANTNDGTLDYPGDYMGVYAIMEKPERGGDRIPVERLDKNDLTGDDVTGGYIVKVDRLDPGTVGWSTTRNFPGTEPFGTEVKLNYGYPEEVSGGPAIPAQQSAYIRNYIQAFEDAVVQTNRTNPATGLHYTDYIDRDSWVDHGLLNILAANADCFRLSTYMHKPRLGKLIAGPIWDFDRTMGSTDSRSTAFAGWSATQPATDIMTWGWWKFLWTEPDFGQQFVDRWFALRDGVLTNANLTGLVTQFESEIAEGAARNLSKWPTQTWRDGPDAGTTATFSDEMDIMRTWLTNRTAWIESQLVPRPVRTPAGGQTASVTLTATQGTIYYTTDGTDPRLPGGGIRPTAQTLASGASATVAGSTLLVARAKISTTPVVPSSGWSAPSTGYYFSGTPAAAGNIIVTELNYHPADPTLSEQVAGFTNSDEFEFIELMNISSGSIDLSGSRFTAGVDFTFPLNTILASSQRVIIVSNRNAFAVRHPEIPYASIAGEYLNDRLENAGELIRLESAAGAVILNFTYGTTGLWPTEADGSGRSLVLFKPAAATDLNAPLNWRASGAANGTPLGTDGTGYATWKSAAGIASDAEDGDQDGMLPLVEYGSGSDPAQPALDRLPVVQRAANGDWIIEITRALSADDADFVLQTATDLGTWTDAAIIIESRVANGDTETFTCKLTNPPAATRFFVRCRWFLRP